MLEGLKKDCFAYIEKDEKGNEKCNALIALFCKKEKCKFYKTKEQYRQELKMAQLRRKMKEEKENEIS